MRNLAHFQVFSRLVELITLFLCCFGRINCSDDWITSDDLSSEPTDGSVLIISEGCQQWLPVNHFYFQLANVCFFSSYLAFNSLNGVIYLRLMLGLGSVLYAVWGWNVLCSFDTFLWNLFFLFLNFGHAFMLLLTYRPVHFDHEVQQVYEILFKPMKVPRNQFKKVVDCLKMIRPSLKRGELFAMEKHTRVESLSLVLSGSMVVMEGDKLLQTVIPMQFVDSPEWFGVSVSPDEFTFQVSIRASEDGTRLLVWHREKLKRVLSKEPLLRAVFDQVLGRDVVRKLVLINGQPGHTSQHHWRIAEWILAA